MELNQQAEDSTAETVIGEETANCQNQNSPLLFLSIVILVLTAIAYLPVLGCGFIWDDDDYVTQNQTLRTLEGLKRIWLEPGAVPQYYPLVHTTFWVEYHLWQLKPLGYHLTNVFLHACSAILLFLGLRRVGLPGAWLAAAIFAIHPVHVESVAWITERKNVLSLFFYLLAALMYLRFEGFARITSASASDAATGNFGGEKRLWNFYAASLFFFVCALLSKTVTCSLPAALLLLIYWKRGRLSWRDVFPCVPFFIIGLGFGLLTAWMERSQVGAVGRFWDHTFIERCLIAGRAVWFYAGKLFYPYPLSFIYPRWTINPSLAWQYIFPVAALGLVAIAWFLRKRLGRGPLVAILFFGGTLFPALGFINVYPMRYSYVADHFQYHASLGLIALFAAAVSLFGRRMATEQISWQKAVGGGTLCLLMFFTWRQVPVYRSYETVFRDALRKSPYSSLALTSVAAVSAEQGNREEAIKLYQRALAVDELDEVAHFNLGKILLEKGETKQGEMHLSRSWNLTPDCGHCHFFYALALSVQGRMEEALPHYEQAIALNPTEAYQHYNYGATLLRMGKSAEAEKAILEALRLKPEMLRERYVLVDHLMEGGRDKEAETILRDGLRYHPYDPDLNSMLKGVIDFRQKKTSETQKP